MYTAYWRLHRRPFDDVDHPQSYFPSQTHQATLLKLHYAIDHRRGAALLAGASGVGKTLLIRALLADLPERYGPRIHVRFPQLDPQQLLAYLASELTGQRGPGASADLHLQRVEGYLQDNARDGRHAVVVIDEAHMLCGSDALQTVRLLLNYHPDWTILLAGQPGLLPALERMPEMDERLGVKCLLHRFTQDESIAYVSHRLVAAGAADVHAVFEPPALESLHQLAEGVPRRINRLADLALLIGYAEQQQQVGVAQVEAVAEELVTPGLAARQAA
jgi:type II secretory pathway predicted ATPase ExeA